MDGPRSEPLHGLVVVSGESLVEGAVDDGIALAVRVFVERVGRSGRQDDVRVESRHDLARRKDVDQDRICIDHSPVGQLVGRVPRVPRVPRGGGGVGVLGAHHASTPPSTRIVVPVM
jgi:hypothetical protein